MLHLAIFYRDYTRGSKRDPNPHWENAEKFTKD